MAKARKTKSASFQIDEARLGDVAGIHRLIHALAEYEKAPQDCVATLDMVEEQLFGESPVARALVVREAEEVIAFALYFRSFSTWLCRPGLYLEDLFVLPAHRGSGIGTALLKRLAEICVEKGYGRMEWSCLEWNELAKGRYRKIGAVSMEEWRVWRLAGERLMSFAEGDKPTELPLEVEPEAPTKPKAAPKGKIAGSLDTVIVYTDGGCRPNPGVGAWAAVLISGEKSKELVGGEMESTNNRMELMAAISALEALRKPCRVEMHTDSQYVKNGISSWIKKWKANSWRRGKEGGEVKNIDLWKRLDEATQRHDIQWKWVRGHAGNKYNERCDVLCEMEIERLQKAGR